MDHKSHSETVKPRAKPSGPFCWLEKAALWRIREGLDSKPWLDQALAVYLAHAELASDAQSPTYKAARRKISARSGVSLRRVAEANQRLRDLGLLSWEQTHIEGSNELGESEYTLLAVKGSAQPALGSASGALGSAQNENSKFAQLYNNLFEESFKNLEEGRKPPSASRKPQIDSDWLAGLKQDPAYEGIDVEIELAKMRRWCSTKHKQPTRSRFINWLNRCDRPLTAVKPNPAESF